MLGMREAEALKIMSALSQATRLKVFVLLANAEEGGLAASDIADQLGTPRNLMSAHLAVLSKAGVIHSTKSGRTVTYRPVLSAVAELGEYLAALGTSKLS